MLAAAERVAQPRQPLTDDELAKTSLAIAAIRPPDTLTEMALPWVKDTSVDDVR